MHSRTIFERAGEHVRKATLGEEDSFIIRHLALHHEDMEEAPGFVFKILGQFKEPLSRQIAETVAIECSVDELLNTREESFQV